MNNKSLISAVVAPIQRRSFPWGAPSWPGGVQREPEPDTLGVNYDTSWSRKYPARLARAALLDWVSAPAVKAIAPPRVSGEEFLSSLESPVIFAPNHASHIDTVILLTSLPPRFRHRCVVAAGADYFFDKRFKAHLWSLTTATIPIERNKVNRQSAQLASSMLEEGWNLIIYSEGGRSPDGWAQPFRGGAAYLSSRTGAPVVPVYLEGTRNVLAKNSKGLRHSATRVVFGKPLVPQSDENTRRFSSRIEAAVTELADATATDWWSARKRSASRTSPSMTGPQAPPWRRSWELERRAASGKPKTKWTGTKVTGH